MTKFLLHQTDQNGLSHVIRPQEDYLLVPTLWLNSVKLKGVSSRFYNKTYMKTNDTSTSLSFTQHNSYFVLKKSLFYSSCSFCLFCLRSINAIERRHWLLASVSIASVLSEHNKQINCVLYEPGMQSRDIFGRIRLRLRLRGRISAPAPAPAPSKTVRRLRLRLREKCTGSGGSGSGSGSDDQVLI